jgi:hypothetical protein
LRTVSDKARIEAFVDVRRQSLSVLINLRLREEHYAPSLHPFRRRADSLLALPDNRDDLIRRYTLSESDLSTIRQRRGAANRLGFAVQLCYLRFPGIVLGVDQLPFAPLLHLAAGQLKIPVEHWAEYGTRAQTRREHLVELQTVFGVAFRIICRTGQVEARTLEWPPLSHADRAWPMPRLKSIA